MIKTRFYELITGNKKQKDERSGEEIVADIVKRGGLKLK